VKLIASLASVIIGDESYSVINLKEKDIKQNCSYDPKNIGFDINCTNVIIMGKYQEY